MNYAALRYIIFTILLLDPNILITTMCSDTSYIHSSLNVRDQVSQKCKTTHEITISCTLRFLTFFVYLIGS
jgi:hypothetical protein